MKSIVGYLHLELALPQLQTADQRIQQKQMAVTKKKPYQFTTYMTLVQSKE